MLLGLRTEAEVRAGYEKVRAAGARAIRSSVPGAEIEGVLVTPMRAGGTELLAGVTVDPSLGPVLAVGLGGVWVEVLRDTALRVLPAGPAEVRAMLGELRGLPLLRGARGTVPADLDVLAAVIARIGETALSLGRGLRALEVNPLWVSGDRIEALDVLIVTEPDGGTANGHQQRTGRGASQMMLGTTEEQEELRASVRRFLTDRAPLSRVRELMETEDGTDAAVWQQAGAQLGLQGLAIPEAYGGAGFTFAEQAIVLEELGAALYGGPYLASAVLRRDRLAGQPGRGGAP